MLLMLILYLHPILLISMSFVFKSFLSLISHVTSMRLKLIRSLLKSQHFMPLKMNLAISLLILMFRLLIFKLKSEISCLNLVGCHITLIFILLISVSIFPGFLKNIMFQLKITWNLFTISLIILKWYTRMLF